jgi:hypothetical protein
VSSDNKRTDEYWMGVRDALRMVDSFNKWAQRNPGRAKSLDDFIHDGLIAAARRCESCLREQLGLSFVKSVHEEDVAAVIDSEKTDVVPLPDIESSQDEMQFSSPDAVPDTDFEISVESKETESDEEITIESEEPPFSIDTSERLEDETMDDIVIEGPQRDFSSDFELVEPSPLDVGSEDFESDRPGIDEQLDESAPDEVDDSEELTSEGEREERPPAFTWSDYEAAVTPIHEPETPEPDSDEQIEAVDDYLDESSIEDDIFSEDTAEEPLPPPAVPKEWNSDDGVSPPDDVLNEDKTDNEGEASHVQPDAEESETADEATHFTEPPSPPPPPESEEDEEERRRRARRLFFGA